MNLATTKMSTTLIGEDRREAVDDDARAASAAPARVRWCFTMPMPAMKNPVNTPIAYSATSASTLARVTSRSTMATAARTMIPLEKDEAVAPPGQLAGQERVAGHEAGEEREPVEAGVAAGVEHEQGGGLDDVEEGPADHAAAEHVVDLLGDHRRRAGGVGHGVGPAGEHGHAEDQERQHRAHDHEGLAGVARLGLAEAAHPVGDGLESGERRPPVGEGPQERDEGQAHQHALARDPDVALHEEMGRAAAGGRGGPRAPP